MPRSLVRALGHTDANGSKDMQAKLKAQCKEVAIAARARSCVNQAHRDLSTELYSLSSGHFSSTLNAAEISA